MATKRPSADPQHSGSSQSKFRKTGIDPKWKKDFPWMLQAGNGQGMICSLCHKHGRRHPQASIGQPIWVDLPARL